jgi:Tfp pilus assembly protein FimV
MLRILSARLFIIGSVIALTPFAVQAQATTTCKDGTTSSATGKGACSGHGGVDKSAKKAAKSDSKASAKVAKTDAKAEPKAAKTETKADAKVAKTESKAASKSAKTPATTTASNTDPNGATAKCKDGTYSHAATRRGACSRHGGVAEWLKS